MAGTHSQQYTGFADVVATTSPSMHDVVGLFAVVATGTDAVTSAEAVVIGAFMPVLPPPAPLPPRPLVTLP